MAKLTVPAFEFDFPAELLAAGHEEWLAAELTRRCQEQVIPRLLQLAQQKQKQCLACQRLFLKRADAKYCSPSCKLAGHRQRHQSPKESHAR